MVWYRDRIVVYSCLYNELPAPFVSYHSQVTTSFCGSTKAALLSLKHQQSLDPSLQMPNPQMSWWWRCRPAGMKYQPWTSMGCVCISVQFEKKNTVFILYLVVERLELVMEPPGSTLWSRFPDVSFKLVTSYHPSGTLGQVFFSWGGGGGWYSDTHDEILHVSRNLSWWMSGLVSWLVLIPLFGSKDPTLNKIIHLVEISFQTFISKLVFLFFVSPNLGSRWAFDIFICLAGFWFSQSHPIIPCLVRSQRWTSLVVQSDRWFQISFVFTPIGEDSNFEWLIFFQMGWNYQLAIDI